MRIQIRWMNLFKTTLCAATVFLLSIGSATALEIMPWNRLPLAVPLNVGQERVIFVDRNVRVGLPSTLSHKLRVQSTGGAVYLLAYASIEPTRIQLQDAETGELILLDIAASVPDENQAVKELEPIKIVESEYVSPVRYGSQQRNTQSSSGRIVSQGKATTVAPTSSSSNSQTAEAKTDTPIPVVLTRYAAQNLYAPLRTVEPVAGISRVNVRKNLDLSTLMPLLPVEANVLATWQLKDYWVTAVLIRNKSIQHITLDPRLLQGDFATATFQHPDLGRRGDASDTTTLYLVTHGHGLAGSLMPALQQLPQVVEYASQMNQNGGDHEK